MVTFSANGAQVILADVEASNGIIHAIDVVLLPTIEEESFMTIVDVALLITVHLKPWSLP